MKFDRGCRGKKMSEAQYSQSMQRLIERLAELPGIGRRTAERLAFHILKSPKDEALALAQTIQDVKAHVRHCSTCFNLTEADPCPLCADPRRKRNTILVVEQPKDVISLEQTHAYDGLYHVLLGRIAPLEGVGPGDLTVEALMGRVQALAREGHTVEVILGLNPTLEGDGTALYLTERLSKSPGVRITRLARGLPSGSQIEYANKAVLFEAIHSRQAVQ